MKTLLNKPGASLLVVSLEQLIVFAPLIGGLRLIGGVLSPIAFFSGIFGVVGGVYLTARSKLGPGETKKKLGRGD